MVKREREREKERERLERETETESEDVHGTLTHKRFCAETLLGRNAFILHTGAFTHSNFYR